MTPGKGDSIASVKIITARICARKLTHRSSSEYCGDRPAASELEHRGRAGISITGERKKKKNSRGQDTKRRDPRRLRPDTRQLSILGGVTSGCDMATYLG